MVTYILRKDRGRTDKVLKPARPNLGIEAAYRRKLYDLIEAMHKSVMYWVEAAYKAHLPAMAQDAEFVESEHPRASSGEFTSGGGAERHKPTWSTNKKKNVQEAIKLIESLGHRTEPYFNPKASGAAYYSHGAISVNAAHKFWRDPVGNMKQQKGVLSSEHPEHAIHHEIGHALFDAPDNWMNPIDEWKIAELVSKYARRNPKEFVSEVYAGIQAGIVYPEVVMNKFKVYARKRASNLAQDATPANEMADAIRKLVRQWMYNFDEASINLADYFAKDVSERSDTALQAILRNGGFTVKFQMSKAMRNIINATVNQNVGLIKSIPQQYLSQVEGMVMRSVQTGRDMGQLSKDLQTQLGVTKRRAALIAKDQNNKASSAMQRARQTEMGITEAVWMHSHGGKVPRPSHVKMNNKRYDVSKGMWDDDEGKYVFPGELINCRCVSRSVIPGFL